MTSRAPGWRCSLRKLNTENADNHGVRAEERSELRRERSQAVGLDAEEDDVGDPDGREVARHFRPHLEVAVGMADDSRLDGLGREIRERANHPTRLDSRSDDAARIDTLEAKPVERVIRRIQRRRSACHRRGEERHDHRKSVRTTIAREAHGAGLVTYDGSEE